jgi:tetratricopeptide (TPR) repeat protein
LGYHEEAVAALKEAQGFWPQPYTLALSLGNALVAAGRREEAVGVLERALREGPGAAEGQAVAVKEALEELLAQCKPLDSIGASGK